MRGNMKRGTLFAALLAAMAAAGCAEDVGDIDRTEPNRVRKSEITEGSWWMSQKIVEVPGESMLESFEGLMTDTDKVVFVAEENYLIAYRSYPHLPGADNQSLNTFGSNNYEELYGADYKGSVVAMFPISSHFDVVREYDAATGEQSNVISENTTDRPWYERDYMRVEWNKNPKFNFDWYIYSDWRPNLELSYMETDEMDPKKAAYFEYDDNNELVYFDAPATYIYQLPFWRWNYGGWIFDMSGGAVEIRTVTSFWKDMGSSKEFGFPGGKSVGEKGTKFSGVMNTNYEPLDYSNQDMNRFGLFRTERYTYDPKLGYMNSGRIELANRHNLWKRAYNDAGELIPVNEREVRTVPYYIFDGVNEEKLAAMSEQVIDEWNVAFKRAVHLIKNPGDTTVLTTIDYPSLKGLLAGEQDVFVACHIPVRKGDREDICGEEGYVPREGDMRKNFLWLVNQRQDVGLLGYCPSVTDPLTGQTISAQAHVYTAPMNEIAQDIVDIIKFAKGELTPEGVKSNDINIARARQNRDRFIELSKMSDKVRSAKINSPQMRAAKKTRNIERIEKISKVREFDYAAADALLDKAFKSGLFASDMDEDALRFAAIGMGLKSTAALPDDVREAASAFNRHSFTNRYIKEEIQKQLGAKGFCFKNESPNYDIEYTYLMNKYKDRTDYDNIFYEIRADVFRATALHEMGHGFGLRHNHTGSYDSINYFDDYWELRGLHNHDLDPNFWKEGKLSTVGEMMNLYKYTDAQLNGGMLIRQYSSIMDYSSNQVNDHNGLGKYDHAAILYSYSAGATRTTSGVEAQKGLVEIFTDGNGGNATRDTLGSLVYDVLKHKDTTGTSTFDDQTAVGQNYLELVHFRDIATGFAKGYDFTKNRKLVRMNDFLASQGTATPMVRVPYLFCTDDNRYQLRSCHVFDAGADYMEQLLTFKRDYDTRYWFRNFARGRALWSTWNSLAGDKRKFDALSDMFQTWYFGDRDLLEDVVGDEMSLVNMVDNTAINGTFNFLANVIATPEHGLFCKRKDNGQLSSVANASDSRKDASEFSVRARCGRDSTYYYVPEGEGRSRFGRFDPSAGFDYSWYELEAEHLWTTIIAMEALFDNEARVIRASNGDMKTYLFGIYDWFRTETVNLMDAMLAEDYSYHSPLLDTSDGNGGQLTITTENEETYTGKLIYPALAKAYAYDENGKYFEYDPFTGMSEDDFEGLAKKLPRVESDTSINQETDLILYGMFFTGYIGMDNTLFDNLNVYRVGSGQTNTPGSNYKAVTFENPFTGEIYGANKLDISKVCAPDANGRVSAMCYTNNQRYSQSGAVMLVERGAQLVKEMESSWAKMIELSDELDAIEGQPDYEQSETYQKYMDALYSAYMTQYDIDDIVRRLNLLRNVYDIFGVVF